MADSKNEIRENHNTKSSQRYVRCEETGEFVDQHGRGFKDTIAGLVATGRLYTRTATTAKPADYPQQTKPTTDPGLTPVSPQNSLEGLTQSPPAILTRLDLSKLTPEFFQKNLAITVEPGIVPMWLLVKYDMGYACGTIVHVAGKTDGGGAMYCVRVPGGAFRSVMTDAGIMYKGVQAIFVVTV